MNLLETNKSWMSYTNDYEQISAYDIYNEANIVGQQPPYNYPLGKNIKSELEIPMQVWNEYYTLLTLLNGIITDIIENVSKKSSFITPVPGGVGPMTIAMLLKNTLLAYKC